MILKRLSLILENFESNKINSILKSFPKETSENIKKDILDYLKLHDIRLSEIKDDLVKYIPITKIPEVTNKSVFFVFDENSNYLGFYWNWRKIHRYKNGNLYWDRLSKRVPNKNELRNKNLYCLYIEVPTEISDELSYNQLKGERLKEKENSPFFNEALSLEERYYLNKYPYKFGYNSQYRKELFTKLFSNKNIIFIYYSIPKFINSINKIHLLRTFFNYDEKWYEKQIKDDIKYKNNLLELYNKNITYYNEFISLLENNKKNNDYCKKLYDELIIPLQQLEKDILYNINKNNYDNKDGYTINRLMYDKLLDGYDLFKSFFGLNSSKTIPIKNILLDIKTIIKN